MPFVTMTPEEWQRLGETLGVLLRRPSRKDARPKVVDLSVLQPSREEVA